MEGSRSTARKVGEVMAAANEAAEVEHGSAAVYRQDDEGGERRPIGRRRFRWGTVLGHDHLDAHLGPATS